MKNFVQPGEMITVVTPTGGLTSGQGIVIGTALFGVAALTTLVSEQNEVCTKGVFDLAKASTDTFAIGDYVYWDQQTNVATSASTSGHLKVGIAIAVAANPSATVRTRLNGAY